MVTYDVKIVIASYLVIISLSNGTILLSLSDTSNIFFAYLHFVTWSPIGTSRLGPSLNSNTDRHDLTMFFFLQVHEYTNSKQLQSIQFSVRGEFL